MGFEKEMAGVRNTEKANTIYLGVMKELFAANGTAFRKICTFHAASM